MSSIVFSSDLENSRFKKKVGENIDTLEDLSKTAEKTGQRIDKSLGSFGQNLKDSIREQKEYIKGLTKEVNEMQKAYNNASAGISKSEMGKELGKAKRTLSEATGELIGMQEEQIAVNNAEKESIDSLTGKLTGWITSMGGALIMLNALKNAFIETTGGLNLFNIAGAVTKQVLYDIVSGGTIEMANIMNAVQVQKSLNEQRMQNAIDSVKIAQYESKYQELYTKSLDKTLSQTDKLKYIDAAIAEHDKAIGMQMKRTYDNMLQIEKLLKTQPDNDKLKLQYADLFATMHQLDARRESETRRLQTERSNIEKDAADEKINIIKQELKDEAELRILNAKGNAEATKAALKKNLDQELANIDLTETQKKLLKAKYAAEIKAIDAAETKKQEDILNKLKRENAKIEDALRKLDPGKGYSMLNRAISNSGGTPASWDVQNEMNKLIPFNQKTHEANKKKQDKENKEELEALDEQIRKRNEILDAVSRVTYELGKQIGLSEEQQQLVGTMLDTMMQVSTGNYFAAAASLITGLLQMIPSEAARFAAQIEDINRLIEEQQRLIDLSSRKGGTGSEIEKQIALLKEQKEIQENELEFAKIKLKDIKQSFFGAGSLFSGSAKKDVKELEQAIQDSQAAIDDAQQSLADFLGGGVTENTLADAIAQGFREGKTSIDDFADYMNEVLVNAILGVFKGEILGPAITALTEQISASLSDKILTAEEKQAIDLKIKEIADANRQLWDDLTGSLDLGGGPQAGLSGGIARTITEDTGSELAGLFRRFADDSRAIKDYNKLGITHLINIEANTFNTVEELKLAVVELKSINSNTKPVFSGEL